MPDLQSELKKVVDNANKVITARKEVKEEVRKEKEKPVSPKK